MTTLRHYRINLGWSIYRLAHEAGISRPAVANAENGQPIKAETAKAIADALSRANIARLHRRREANRRRAW